MSLLKRLFGGKDRGDAPEAGENEEPGFKRVPSSSHPLPVTMEILKQLFPIRNLGEDQLSVFALNREAEVWGAGSILFRMGAPVDSVHYLLEGTVQMDVGGDKGYEVSADTAKARFPLCCGKEYSATATAATEVQILRVSPKIMSRGKLHEHVAQAILDPEDADIPVTIRESRLFQGFCEYYRNEELHLPSLPEVAFKLRQAINHDVGIGEIAAIIQLDPVIAAKVVHVANSPLYLPSRPINNCQDAVNRLGLLATRNLVTAFSLKQVFHSKDTYINKLLHSHWKQSVYLSCLCHVLAADNTGVNPEEALLAGLTCEIGAVPFIHFADNLPRSYWQPGDLDAVLPHVQGPVGAFVLRQWDFPAELTAIPVLADDWYYDGGDTLTLADIVILSKLHACIGTPRSAALPAINSIPACAKLKDRRLSPAYSLHVLHEARDKIAESMKLFET